MEIIKKKRIVLRTTRRVVVCESNLNKHLACGLCESSMISTNSCADLIGISNRMIFRLIEAEKIHFIESENKKVYVCIASIKQNMIPDFGENDVTIIDTHQLQR